LQKIAAFLALAALLVVPTFVYGQQASSSPSVATIKQGAGTPLCKLLLKQARQLKPDGNLCMLPLDDSKHGIGVPNWTLEKPTPELLGFIRKNLLRIYSDLPVSRWYPNLSTAEARERASDDLWRSIEPQLASGEGRIYSALRDEQIGGIGRTFFAIQTFWHETDRPDGQWQPYFCDSERKIPDLVIFATDVDPSALADQMPMVLEGRSGVLFYDEDEFFIRRAKNRLYIDQVIDWNRTTGRAEAGGPVCELRIH